MFFLPCADQSLVFPDSAGVIFGARNDCVTLVVEGAGEDFIFVALARIRTETLYLISALRRPQSARFVRRGRDDLVSLWIKRDFTNFVLVSLQNGRACAREHVVDSRHTIRACRRQLVASLVEAGVEYLVVVSAEFFNALAGSDVPKTRRSINGASEAVVASEIELAAGELGRVPVEREEALTRAHVPNLRRVIEGRGH